MCRRPHSPIIGNHPQQLAIQIKKPCLARTLVGSAKINLNEYWNVLEAAMDPGSTNCENENIDNERRLANLSIGCQKGSTTGTSSTVKLPPSKT